MGHQQGCAQLVVIKVFLVRLPKGGEDDGKPKCQQKNPFPASKRVVKPSFKWRLGNRRRFGTHPPKPAKHGLELQEQRLLKRLRVSSRLSFECQIETSSSPHRKDRSAMIMRERSNNPACCVSLPSALEGK